MKRGSMKRKKSSQRALVAYLCHFRPEPEGGFTVTCPKLPPVVTYGETLEEAQANAREAIELCLEVMREDGQPILPPDRDLASPIDRLMPVPAADDDGAQGYQRNISRRQAERNRLPVSSWPGSSRPHASGQSKPRRGYADQVRARRLWQ
jgi:antitoxin HicB